MKSFACYGYPLLAVHRTKGRALIAGYCSIDSDAHASIHECRHAWRHKLGPG